MPDWHTRLEITVGNTVITPIDSFIPTFTSKTSAIHSIEQDNVGYLYKPVEASFQMRVQAIGSAVAELTQMALAGTKFSIQVAEKQGSEWSFKKLLFRDCVITTANPSDLVQGEAPVAIFKGSILGFGDETDIET